MFQIIGLGEIMSLACAVSWGTGVILMRRCSNEVTPLVLNIFKISLAFILLIPTIYFANESLAPLLNGMDVLLLMISGIIGVGVADTLWLTALKRTDASTMAIIDCSYSPSVVGLSFVFLGERLTWIQLLGCLMVVLAIFFVSFQTKRKKNLLDVDHRGFVIGTVAVLMMAVGIVIVKPILDRFPLFLAIEVRLAAGLVVLLLQAKFSKTSKEQFMELVTLKHRTSLILGSFLAAYLAMIFWVGGTKYTDASIAAILNQTSTFFIIFMAWVFLKEEISWVKIAGCVVGFAGCILII